MKLLPAGQVGRRLCVFYCYMLGLRYGLVPLSAREVSDEGACVGEAALRILPGDQA